VFSLINGSNTLITADSSPPPDKSYSTPLKLFRRLLYSLSGSIIITLIFGLVANQEIKFLMKNDLPEPEFPIVIDSGADCPAVEISSGSKIHNSPVSIVLPKNKPSSCNKF
jgi:hypothetical protein